MTSWEDVHNAIRARFETEIEDGQSVEVQYDNAPSVDIDESSTIWINFQIHPGMTFTAETGNVRTSRTPGVATAQIFTAIEQGDKEALEMADYIKAAFRHVTASGVVFQTPYVRRIGRVDKWWQTDVVCPFYSDYIA